jgi:hypothetical protein
MLICVSEQPTVGSNLWQLIQMHSLLLFPAAEKVTKKAAAADKLLKINFTVWPKEMNSPD